MHTAMIQMRCKLRIPMSSGRDMEIPLHLIPLQTPIDPTRIRLLPPPQLWPLRKLLARIPPHLPEHMADMRILLLRLDAPTLLLAQRLIHRIRPTPAIALVHPQIPTRILLLE